MEHLFLCPQAVTGEQSKLYLGGYWPTENYHFTQQHLHIQVILKRKIEWTQCTYHKHLSVKHLGLILCNVHQLFRHIADAVKTEDNSAC